MTTNRSSFSSRLGFVMAAAGSAVGLGNLWRFPYLAAKYGGGIFLLVYVLLLLTFGFALMVTEIAIGRKTRLSCISAYGALSKRFAFLGWLAALVPIIITPYYCVIGGWVLKYLFEFTRGNGLVAAGDQFFGTFIAAGEPGALGSPVLWFVLFILLTAVIVGFGVEKGIEKASKVLMPILVVLSIVVAGFSLAIPGAMAGLKFYLLPDFSHFSWMTVLAAMGQMFYSMSLAMGIMITYGSYMKKENKLEHSVGQIEIFDTGIAMIAGLMIIPAVVAFSGGDTTMVQSTAGPGLMFGVLPKVFETMPAGGLVGTLFFLLVGFAALTSSISLMEAIVSSFMDKFHIGRGVTVVLVTVLLFALGILSCLGYGPWSGVQLLGMAFLDFFDFISNSVLMPIVALCTCILIGYGVGTSVVEEEVKAEGAAFRREKLYRVMIRWVAPVLLLLILVTSVMQGLGIGGFKI